MSPTRQTNSHWHVRYRQDILGLQVRHARGIKDLADKAKVDPATARQLVDVRVKHFRNQNRWNDFQAWVRWKHNHPGGLPEGETRAVEGQVEPTMPSSTRLDRLADAYMALTSANKKFIQSWAAERVGNKPVTDHQKELNRARRDLIKRIAHLQLRFGISAVAILAHPGEGIAPQVAWTNQSSVATSSALNGIKKGTTADDLATMFDRAVKLSVWDHPANESLMDQPIIPCELGRAQRLAKDIIERLHAVIGPALADNEEATAVWDTATRKGTRMRYKGFFSMVAEAQCAVQGWPMAASVLLKDDAILEHDSNGTTITIFSGSLANTATWKDDPMTALRTALQEETLRALSLSLRPTAGEEAQDGRNEDEFDDHNAFI